jgi:hypothetical protein
VRRRASTCIGFALVLVLATGALAVAATYRGGGTEDPKVRVRFEKDRDTIKGFKIERARFFCTDGDRFRAGTRVGRMEVRRRRGERRFGGYFTNPDGTQSSRIRGRLIGRRKARGNFRLTASFGDVGCTTRRVHWKARRKPSG